MPVAEKISAKVIERVSLYRQLLQRQQKEGKTHFFSRQLARLSKNTSAQVRRDIMLIGFTGTTNRGYDINDFIEHIARFIDGEKAMNVAIIGVGNLGRAIISYYGRDPKLRIVAGFDTEPDRIDRVILGCQCHHISELETIVREKDISIAIVTVPESAAQAVVKRLCSAGVTGILNFAPVKLWVPDHVYIEDIFLGIALDKVAFYTQSRRAKPGAAQ
ncbi:MAG: redox-sensing transcriptional repressor Rex [Planctomycetota bacterium]